MNPDLSGLLSCSYGTTAFQAETYEARNTAIVRDGHGRIGSTAEVRVQGYIGASSETTLAEALTAAYADLNTDGRDFAIFGPGGTVELSIPAALCINGGPHLDFEIGAEGPAPGTRRISLRVWTSAFPSGSNTPVDAYRVATATGPDGLRTITRTGEVMGPNVVEYLTVTAFKGFQASYALPSWVTHLQYDLGAQQIQSANPSTRYTFTAKENFGPLPGGVGAAGGAVQGTASRRVERDEQMRKTTVYDYDLVLTGDAMQFLNQLRPIAPAIVLRETVDLETVAQNHLKASFTVLESGDSTAIMNWEESFHLNVPGDTWEEKTYVGAAPILIRSPQRFGRVTQTGSATGQGQFKAEPVPAFPFAAELPEITYRDVNVVEKQTQWSYPAFAADPAGNPVGASIGTTQNPMADPALLGREGTDAQNGVFHPAAKPRQSGSGGAS